MRSLIDLLGSPDGHTFLEERGVQVSEDAFVGGLRTPVRSGLGDVVDLGPGSLVYTAHQLQCDYALSVTAKLRTLADFNGRDDIAPLAAWLDMDRTGSNKLSTSIAWPRGGGSVRLAPQRFKEREPRFVPVERDRLQEVMAKLEAWARSVGDDGAIQRHRPLAEALLADGVDTLADANLRLTSAMLKGYLGVEVPSVLVSEVAARGLLTEPVEAAVADLDGFVGVFNAAIDALVAADVDPQVRHLGEGYFPLRYSCSNCQARCTLVHRRRDADHFAEVTCRSCGAEHRFHLGSGTPSAGEVFATGRWSADVSLPAYLNDLVSGVVVGRSSALYGLVLNEVVAKVLGGDPVPALIPPRLSEILETDSAGSLLYEYLTSG
ncbi:MAG TPA: hypothetical protein VJP08_02330 [Actinomycetota bacterium]|nr:hypothetical protein [Actinomycetota bacterium]